MYRVIDERGFASVDASPEQAQALLTDMVLARVFDERAVALQRRGWMSGYPPFEGQEASQVGAAHALAESDRLFPTYRANAMQLARGRSPADLLQFRRGRSSFESRLDDPTPRRRTTFTQATPIATQLPHAVGAGMAVNYLHGEGERTMDDPGDTTDMTDAADGTDATDTTDATGADPVVCSYFGDGATSEGDFHEAMNFAGVFDAPIVFFCENNGWAISTSVGHQTASDTIAGKADAYGFDGVQVDGNDPLAVRECVADARETARDGDPVLVESLTYRRGAHTTSDDPDRYRGEVDLPEWRTADPIERYATYLRDEGVVDDEFVPAAREAAEETVAEAVVAVEDAPDADPADAFDFAYATLPPAVREQRAAVLRRADERGAPEEE